MKRVEDAGAASPSAREAILTIRVLLLDEMQKTGDPIRAARFVRAYRWLKSQTDEIVEAGW